MPRRRAAAEPAVEELDELDELTDEGADDDLEELEDAAPEPAPAKRTRGAKAAPAKAAPAKAAKSTPAQRTAPESSGFDSNWLAGYITEETGVEYDSRAVRMLLRKAAKDGLLAREVGTDRQRYDFPKGANDPVVKAILKMVRTGEAAAVKREGLDAAKAAGAAKKAAAKATPAPAAPAKRTAKAAPAEAPAPASRRRRPANA